jgi:hypothetical protein
MRRHSSFPAVRVGGALTSPVFPATARVRMRHLE